MILFRHSFYDDALRRARLHRQDAQRMTRRGVHPLSIEDAKWWARSYLAAAREFRTAIEEIRALRPKPEESHARL